MSDLTIRDLYALMIAEYGDGDFWERAWAGDRWVMDLASYKRVRAACKAANLTYPPVPGGDAGPDPEDQLFGLPVEVREGGGEPYLERDERMRP